MRQLGLGVMIRRLYDPGSGAETFVAAIGKKITELFHQDFNRSAIQSLFSTNAPNLREQICHR